MNPLKRGWLDECCELGADLSADFSSRWKSFAAWQEDQRLKPWEQLSKQEFAAKLSALNFASVTVGRVAHRVGLQLKETAPASGLAP